jgi:hypothetical protein
VRVCSADHASYSPPQQEDPAHNPHHIPAGAGVAAAAAAAAVGPVHGAVGTTLKIPLYSSGYVHPETVTTPPAVSLLSNQPSTPDVALAGAAVSVDASAGSVIAGPVAVYVGSRLIGTLMPDMLAGGYAYVSRALGGIVDAGAPVCHGAKDAFHAFSADPSARQVPA